MSPYDQSLMTLPEATDAGSYEDNDAKNHFIRGLLSQPFKAGH